MTIGVYKLVFTGTDKVYVGQSINVERRFATHISAVKAGKSGQKLSEAFNTYGVPNMFLLIECEKEELDFYENKYILENEAYTKGFNTLSKAENIPKPDNSGVKNGQSKYPESKIVEVFNYLLDNTKTPLTEVSEVVGLPYHVVAAIASCTNHRWLQSLYPDKYLVLEKLVGRYTGKSAHSRGIVYPCILSPKKEEYLVTNIRQFAIEHGLDRGCLCRLLNGKAKSHKGWKLKKPCID